MLSTAALEAGTGWKAQTRSLAGDLHTHSGEYPVTPRSHPGSCLCTAVSGRCGDSEAPGGREQRGHFDGFPGGQVVGSFVLAVCSSSPFNIIFLFNRKDAFSRHCLPPRREFLASDDLGTLPGGRQAPLVPSMAFPSEPQGLGAAPGQSAGDWQSCSSQGLFC